MSEAPKKGPQTGRNGRGQFTRGGPGGPGRPAGTYEHRAALRAAITPEDVQTVMRTLYDLALEGDVGAAKLLLERVIGKPREQAVDTTFDPGPLDSADEVLTALRWVVRLVSAGEMPADHGRVVVDMLSQCLEAGEIDELLKNADLPDPWRRN